MWWLVDKQIENIAYRIFIIRLDEFFGDDDKVRIAVSTREYAMMMMASQYIHDTVTCV